MHLSATDLTNFLACNHLGLLNRATKLGGPKPPKYPDPALDILKARGLEHEAAYEDRLRAEGREVLRIDEPDLPYNHTDYWARYTEATLDAMRRGVDVIVQGGLWDGPGEFVWRGKPDFLCRVDVAPGSWTYEVIDTKLAREAKGGALLQILLYAQLVERLHGIGPEFVHLELGGPVPRRESFRVDDYAAYFRFACSAFHDFHTTARETPVGPDPVAHCGICDWRQRCSEERRSVDHLSLVAGISGRQRQFLREAGIHTLEALAKVDIGHLHGVSTEKARSLTRVREQARIQLEGREADAPRYELFPVEEKTGLAMLPAPSPGDLFFDLEGNPYAFTHGIEYLFGYVDASGDYTVHWALDRAEEKRVFEEFIDFVIARREEYPDFHIYHFAAYEESALKRLMGFHTTREAEVDRILRGGLLVDLHKIIRQSLRASVESYSIKKLEPFYGYEREEDLRDASTALAQFDAWLEMGQFNDESDQIRAAVERYNRDDCVSTLRLRNWLEELRVEAEKTTGGPLPRPDLASGEPDDALKEREAEIALRYDALMANVPADPDERTPEQQARWLLAQLLEFHRREKKAFWWEYFRCLELQGEERIEDRATLGGLEYIGVVGEVKQSLVHRYSFPPQDHAIRKEARDIDTEKTAGTVEAIDSLAGTIDLKRGRNSKVPHPTALVSYDRVPDTSLRNAILRVADGVLAQGISPGVPSQVVVDLLLRQRPRLRNGGSDGDLVRAGETPLDAACRIVMELDRTVLPIQGPPGAGKTYTGAKMILAALQAGKRVGVTATSHKVIGNLLETVCRDARAAGFPLRVAQKADEEVCCNEPEIQPAGSAGEVLEALTGGQAQLAAGTAWLWADESMVGAVDLLFIDEAGQFSLANTVAAAAAAHSLVLLGDPAQLEQPQQGVHPPGTDLSVLDHLLDGAVTLPVGKGLFLKKTYRLHPDLCAFTSEIFYGGRLKSQPSLKRQQLSGPEPFGGSGLRWMRVDHRGNQSESAEEAETIARVVGMLMESYRWTDKEGVERPVTLGDILVVAPFNAQVAMIANVLPDGARVGTVDKFQGQEAPVVIYSVTSSSAQDAPRGMEFLYNPSRLNVATSRARCLALIVATPEIFAPECSRPEQMRLANAFCRFKELAVEVS